MRKAALLAAALSASQAPGVTVDDSGKGLLSPLIADEGIHL